MNCPKLPVVCLIVLVLAVAGVGRASEANLLANGGFEKDADGDGVADGWVAEPCNFSRETLEGVQEFIHKLPSADDLLKQKAILAADGSVLWERAADGTWPAERLGTKGYWRDDDKGWYENLRNEDLLLASRFGLPDPDGPKLGRTTLVLSARQKGQVVSPPVTVKPNTGYRLIFWVRTSGGQEYVRFAQVLDATAGGTDTDPLANDYYSEPRVLNALPAGQWWGSGSGGRYWVKMELPFRTGPRCDQIIIRLPFNKRDQATQQKMQLEGYRIWYDDFELIEDDLVFLGDVGSPRKPEVNWPAEAVARGFVVAPRPACPVTYSSYTPDLQETEAPLELALAPGETGSAVLFVKNLLKEDLTVRADSVSLYSDIGASLHGANSGARYVTIRAAELAWLRFDAKRYAYTPKYLLNSSQLTVKHGSGGQFWLTVRLSEGTPPSV